MSPSKPLSPSTIAAHAGGATDPVTGGVVPPLQFSTTFARNEDYTPINPNNIYLRDQNDAMRLAESILAKLEQAEEALLFPSGMAAIAAVFRTLRRGDGVLVQSNIYWGTTKWIRDFCARREVVLHEVDASDHAALQAACQAHKPKMLFIETPSNPWLKTSDIRFAADCAKEAKAILVVDSTAATPILTRPLEFGADIVMHSATKAINGHSDVLAGALATNDASAQIWQDIRLDRQTAGAVIGPFEAWLLVRGMRTLPLRMERMSQNAMVLAEYLLAHPKVEGVFYPGLPSHSGHQIAAAQMSGGYGCLMSFLVKGDAAAALRVAGRLQLFQRATSLGGVESLVEHRYTIEPHTGIPQNLLRVSIGIEDVNDLRADLDQALNG